MTDAPEGKEPVTMATIVEPITNEGRRRAMIMIADVPRDIYDIVRRYEARLRQAEAALRWRPIESAPKDGTHILVFPALLGVPLIATWEKTRDVWNRPANPPFGFWRAALTMKPTPYKPTHWLPLPPVPTGEDDAD